MEGVPCRGRRNGVYTQRAAVTSEGFNSHAFRRQKLSLGYGFIQGLAYPSR
jgi:hypothetical protein